MEFAENLGYHLQIMVVMHVASVERFESYSAYSYFQFSHWEPWFYLPQATCVSKSEVQPIT